MQLRQMEKLLLLRRGALALRHTPLGSALPATGSALLHTSLVATPPSAWQQREQAWSAKPRRGDLHAFHTGLPRLAETARQEEHPPHPEGTQIHRDASDPDKGHATFEDGYIAPHPGSQGAPQGASAPTKAGHSAPGQASDDKPYWLMQPIYSEAYVNAVKPRHKVPKTLTEKTGWWAVTALRSTFDLLSGYSTKPGAMTEQKWLFRIIFLETTAGVPGMVGAALRHFRSLRTMQRDHGWIHTLLEEAENERMHLLTFLAFSKPGPVMRAMVLLGQGVFFNLYFLFYIISPRHCHSFVGYLEEEAVKTYTHCLEDIDNGGLWKDEPAPEIAKRYWGLKEDAVMRDVVAAVRADEACHSHVNHTFTGLAPDDTNPFSAGSHQVP